VVVLNLPLGHPQLDKILARPGPARITRPGASVEILHHFGIKLSSDGERQEFLDLGIDLEPAKKLPNGNAITSFEIGERDPRWMAARQLAAKFQITESARTEFSESEIEAAEAICILASSHRGYPEPSKKSGFLAATFDLSDYCSKCGIGRRQVSPFRIKTVPVLKRTLMQLNWILDEFFVSREMWAAIFKPKGIECWPVVLHRTGEEIASVVQLKVSDYTDLVMDEEAAVTCSHCGRKKFRMELKGFSPVPVSTPAPLFKSAQYFGSDAGAFKRVLMTSSLYRDIKRNSLRGLDFYPCGHDSGHLGAAMVS
jgi:hypothetical protein